MSPPYGAIAHVQHFTPSIKSFCRLVVKCCGADQKLSSDHIRPQQRATTHQRVFFQRSCIAYRYESSSIERISAHPKCRRFSMTQFRVIQRYHRGTENGECQCVNVPTCHCETDSKQQYGKLFRQCEGLMLVFPFGRFEHQGVKVELKRFDRR